jgi:hypothetical protein
MVAATSGGDYSADWLNWRSPVSEHLTAKQVEAIERHIDAGICDCAHRYNITVLCREWRSQTADLAKARADLAAAREREERMREALVDICGEVMKRGEREHYHDCEFCGARAWQGGYFPHKDGCLAVRAAAALAAAPTTEGGE